MRKNNAYYVHTTLQYLSAPSSLFANSATEEKLCEKEKSRVYRHTVTVGTVPCVGCAARWRRSVVSSSCQAFSCCNHAQIGAHTGTDTARKTDCFHRARTRRTVGAFDSNDSTTVDNRLATRRTVAAAASAVCDAVSEVKRRRLHDG